MHEFRWNAWNLDHATRHGISVEEAEVVVNSAHRPYPQQIGDDKLQFIGRGQSGRFVQVICIPDDDGTLYVIHARPITPREKRRLRRRTK